MAIFHPSLSTFHPLSAGAYRERDMLQLLESGLPDNFDVFHSVEWASMHEGAQHFGELDIVVVTPNGYLVILEVKAGSVAVANGLMTKTYAQASGVGRTKDVGFQSRRQYSAMRQRLTQAGLGHVYVAHLLVLPDFRVVEGTVAHPRERIVDADEVRDLCAKVIAATPDGRWLSVHEREQILHFLENRFQVHEDVSTHLGQLQRLNIALADGLATWVPRITHEGGVYVVQATAGSGKSQLALALLKEAAQQKGRAAYFCFNRPLADHLRQLVPSNVEVETFHQHCLDALSRRGVRPDFSSSTVFGEAVQSLVDHADEQISRLDVLIVDESQDFEPEWVGSLLPLLNETGRLYVLGDPAQQLYARDAFDLEHAVHVRSDDNFRSPRRIVDAINQLQLVAQPIRGRSAYAGEAPGFHTYASGPEKQLAALEGCLKGLLSEGISPSHIAVVSFMGRERSEVLSQQRLAGMRLRVFSGRYDAGQNPIWTDGELLADSVYRFKGQSAPVVVLCEVDFTELTDKVRSKLFVGFTRAQFRLECVLTEVAASLLLDC